MSQQVQLKSCPGATVACASDTKLILSFPSKGALLQLGRSEFEDLDDVRSYISSALQFPPLSGPPETRAVIARRGKYQRIDDNQRAVFTFGDPILDLITDKDGRMVVARRLYDLRAAELADPVSRGGGVSNLDLTPRHGEMDDMVRWATLSQLPLTVESASAEGVTLALASPSVVWFPSPTAAVRMRFRAFKKNYFWGAWKMGADIETWGRNFERAEIVSAYGYSVHPGVCAVTKRDSDSDTNDDYLDEYEFGVVSSAPDGVSSLCTAVWSGTTYSRYVSKGSCQVWL